MTPPTRRLLPALGPGMLIAATGVGAGDLATAAFAGAQLGTAVLWGVLLGAALKWVLTEGLARWQLATGSTLLEGATARLGPPVAWIFLAYLLLWSFFVAAALMSACGVTMHALLPLFDDARQAKVVFGVAHSALGLALVWRGGYRLVERVMAICVGLMFVAVVVTALLLWPGAGPVLRGLLPSRATLSGAQLGWTVALIGGVGGTVTILCYGYWMRERGRAGEGALALTRLDLGVAYAVTALFGLCMVIIGSTVVVDGTGAGLVVALAERLREPLGPAGRWVFLCGAWAAVFSSLLGVWQAVPYLFADLWPRLRRRAGPAQAVAAPLTATRPYRVYMLLLASVPALGLLITFRQAQQLYAVVGAAFLPLLALVLLLLNSRAAWIGARLRNRLPATGALLATLLFFSWILVRKLLQSM